MNQDNDAALPPGAREVLQFGELSRAYDLIIYRGDEPAVYPGAVRHRRTWYVPRDAAIQRAAQRGAPVVACRACGRAFPDDADAFGFAGPWRDPEAPRALVC